MKPELTLLVWAVLLAFVQVLVAVQGAMMQVGLVALAGNREHFPEITGWAGRAMRALVLVAAVADKTNAMTLLGAQIFFWARLVYAIVYVVGLPWVRTGVWAVSVVGLALIFAQLV